MGHPRRAGGASAAQQRARGRRQSERGCVLADQEPVRASATRRTLDNSVLIGLDVGISFLAAMSWSIPVARVIGPAKLGYFSVVWFWALVGTNVASLGVPGATRRYMAEALGRNDLKLARGIFAGHDEAPIADRAGHPYHRRSHYLRLHQA